MTLRTRLWSAAAALALLAGMIYIAMTNGTVKGNARGDSLFSRKTTLYLWYNDEVLSDYLNEVAVAYNSSQDEYRVEPVLKDAAEYLEAINQASVAGEEFPDLYVISNDSLGRASLAGLTAPLKDLSKFEDTAIFPQAAINAVTWQGNVVAYPFYFETAAFLYNEEYLQMMADKAGISLQEAVPDTVLDILALADSFDAPEGVQSVFTWDVGDIFYNYYVIGNYLNLGGDAGDDVSQIDIYNTDTIQCMQLYQQLTQFFSIDSSSVDYDSVMDDFVNGRVVFTVATTDVARRMREATADGTADFSYGVSRIPDLTDELKSRSMSVTQCLAINGYSDEQEAADHFIQYMIYYHNEDFYDRTGKALAQSGYAYSDTHMNGFYDAYVESEPVPKMRQTANFWVYLENSFAQVWDGADAGATLKSLYEQIMTQINGETYTAQEVTAPEPVDINAALMEREGSSAD